MIFFIHSIPADEVRHDLFRKQNFAGVGNVYKKMNLFKGIQCNHNYII